MAKIAFLLLCLLLITAGSVLAAPSGEYSCLGKNALNGEAVYFNVLFSDWNAREGYMDQIIGIKDVAGQPASIIFQMYKATKRNECQRNRAFEIYLNNENFKITPAERGDFAPFIMTFQSNCAEAKFQVRAFCFTN